MPLYEYQCDACGQRFEVIRKFSDPPLETCARCGKGPIQRLFSSPAIQFKGSGWYITDYSQKGKSSESTSPAKSDSDASPAKSSDTKKDSTTTPTSSSTTTSKADS
jgi:putative FmdB family regulatory protein